MSSKQSVQNSIANAVSQSMISPETAQTILEPLDDVAIAGAAGVDIDQIDSEEVTLVAVVIDASGSMYEFRNSVIDAYNNHLLSPLRGAKGADSIYMTSWTFSANGPETKDYCKLLHGYVPVVDAPVLTEDLYDPIGGTPLYMAVQKSITGLISYGQTLRDAGTRTKCIVVILSDGEENSSGTEFSSAKIKRLSEDLLKQEMYVLSYVYFGEESKGASIAGEIGFPDRHRISASLSSSDIRRIFGTISSSIISASQSQVSSAGLSANPFFVNP